MNLSPQALGLVVTKPILQERRVERRGTEGVESEPLSGMHNGQLPRESQHGSLARRVGQLRGGGADEGDDGGGVDDGTLGLLVLAQGEDGVLAAEPDALDVDGLGQVPDLLGRVDGVGVVGVHDARVVEHDVDAAPRVDVLHQRLDVGLLRHVRHADLDLVHGGDELLQLLDGALQRWRGDVGEEHVGTLTGEED